VQQYLREQGRLTAVERFSQRHDALDLPPNAKTYRDLIPLAKPKAGEQYAFEVDLDACTGCKACVTACHQLNGLDADEGETWRTVGEASFKIEDGALVGSGTLKKNSFLVSPEPLADFVFETDVYIEADRNSGIQIRSHVSEEGRVYGYQIEIDGSDRAWSGGLYDEGRRGWLQSLAQGIGPPWAKDQKDAALAARLAQA
jgi:ferredoxin